MIADVCKSRRAGVMTSHYWIVSKQLIKTDDLYTFSKTGVYRYFYGFNLRAYGACESDSGSLQRFIHSQLIRFCFQSLRFRWTRSQFPRFHRCLRRRSISRRYSYLPAILVRRIRGFSNRLRRSLQNFPSSRAHGGRLRDDHPRSLRQLSSR